MKLARLPTPAYKSDFVTFGGGLDIVTPAFLIPSGYVKASVNYEQDINGGYKSLTGYERFDGRASPSLALIFALDYSVLGTVVVGSALIGAISGATATVIAVTPTQLIITQLVGDFVAESVGLGATVVGVQIGVAGTSQQLAIYNNQAADVYRALIAAVPGTGRVLGVWYYRGIVYAFRNNVGAGVGMYKSSASGWTAVALGIEVTFTAGSGTAPVVGASIVKGATSGTLARLILESGTFGAGTAAGRLIFASVTAGPFTAGAFTSGITATAGTQTTVTIPNKDGRFEFINASFTGSNADFRMYGVDGVNRGFEYDGTTFVGINTPLDVTQKPSHVAAHQNHLFYSYETSMLNSNIGFPYGWQTTGGTVEIAVADTITGFMVQPGSDTSPAMAVYCRNHTHILYGKTSATFQMVDFNDQAGAIPYTIQKIHQTYVFDDRGVTSLQTAQEFGNFAEATLSFRVKPLLASKRARACDSHIARDKQQYRLFFNDGSGAYFMIDQNNFSMMPVLFPNPVRCSVSSEIDGGGDEVIFFGSDNGFVYQMERGTSFDGAEINTELAFVYNNSKSYRALKRYRHLTFELEADGFHQFNLGYDLSYLSEEAAQPDLTTNPINLNQIFWDSFIWDEFTWDGDQPLRPLHLAINGDGQNLAVKITSSSDSYSPLKFSGYFLEFSLLRMLR
jgi:hypothetical protein